MLDWTRWEGEAAQWDAIVRNMQDFTVFQSYAWGAHRARFGWIPLRLLAHEEGQVIAVAQVLVRRYSFGIGVIWIPGGPLGKPSAWNSTLRQAVCKAAGFRFFYCRLNNMANHNSELVDTMLANGWLRTSRPLSSGLSLEYSPSLQEEQRMLRCSGNWRHNLRRSFKRRLFTSVWANPDPYEMMKAYGIMQDLKNLAAQTSIEEIESILCAFGNQCIIVRCDDESGHLLALRGAIIMGSKAWDIFAVSSPAGRKVYASHAAFWELMSQCAHRGVVSYDMGGADPISNRGVYDFKKGTGAIDTKQLGEWEFSNLGFLRHIANYLIGRRRLI
jgi:lipid II:glycine glycyltransferase (peptidoglycan interpeptide bridge formation enzyme)